MKSISFLPALCTALTVAFLVGGGAAPASAQIGGLQDLLGGSKSPPTAGSRTKIEAKLTPGDAQPGDVVTLSVTARIPEGGYTYPTGAVSFGQPTRIMVTEAAGLSALDDDFQADRAPKIEFDPLLMEQLEKLIGDVTWTRRYRMLADARPESVVVKGQVRLQVCDDATCTDLKSEFEAALAADGTEPSAAAPTVAASAASLDENPLRHEDRPRVAGKPGPATVHTELAPRDAAPGDRVTLAVRLTLDEPWYTYAMTQDPRYQAQPAVIELEPLHGLEALGEGFTADREPVAKQEDIGDKRYHYEVHPGEVVWTRDFQVTAADYGLRGTLRYQVCTEVTCNPPKTVEFALGALPLEERSASEPPRNAAGDATFEAGEAPVIATGERSDAARAEQTEGGLVAFLIAAVLAGFLALLTPCVFPMVPITVSFFLKQSEREHHRPVWMAAIYCLGIMFTFTGLGVLIAALYGGTAVQQLANNPWLNLFIAGVLVFFGLNLLGLFEIRIPSGLLTWSSGKEGQGGIAGTLFMALTFTLVTFTCTFAFAGALLVWAAKGDYFWPILGMLAFSAAFSLPFFFLALFPSYLQKLPKSGGWMNTVKVTVGLVELGAAFKFFGIADLAWNPVPALFDYTLVMSAWAIIVGLAGLYLLGLFRLSHDTPSDTISPLRFLFAMSFLGLAGYMAVGLFGPDEPRGMLWDNIRAQAPPTLEGGEDDIGPFLVGKHDGLRYALDYEQAVRYARDRQEPLFLDFTGVNCVNCRRMEIKMAEPHNRERLENFIRVALYTDYVPHIQDRALANRLRDSNLKLQEDWFGNVTLPAYAVVTPDGRTVLATYEGLERQRGQFAAFLDDGLTRWRQTAAGGVQTVQQPERAAGMSGT